MAAVALVDRVDVGGVEAGLQPDVVGVVEIDAAIGAAGLNPIVVAEVHEVVAGEAQHARRKIRLLRGGFAVEESDNGSHDGFVSGPGERGGGGEHLVGVRACQDFGGVLDVVDVVQDSWVVVVVMPARLLVITTRPIPKWALALLG